MSLSVRLNDVRFIVEKRWRVMALARANSRRPSAPWMRPKPESPTPPNGSAGTAAKAITALIEVIPPPTRPAARPPGAREGDPGVERGHPPAHPPRRAQRGPLAAGDPRARQSVRRRVGPGHGL